MTEIDSKNWVKIVNYTWCMQYLGIALNSNSILQYQGPFKEFDM